GSFLPPATPHTHTLSLHDALPIYQHLAGGNAGDARKQHAAPALDALKRVGARLDGKTACDLAHGGEKRQGAVIGGHCFKGDGDRSEEHTSELQSRENLVWRLLLEK